LHPRHAKGSKLTHQPTHITVQVDDAKRLRAPRSQAQRQLTFAEEHPASDRQFEALSGWVYRG
jgi:hypothetical protein